MQPERRQILLVEDDEVVGGTLRQRLRIEGYGVDWERDAPAAAASLAARLPDLLLSDLRLPGGSGEELFLSHRERLAGTPFLAMTGYAEIDQAIRLLKAGVDDFLVKPIATAELLARIEELLARRIVPVEKALLGPSAAIRGVEAVLRRAAGGDHPTLLLGETGTGKEVAARLLHGLSPRNQQPFIAVNCAAIPADLLESEVFGHERGAFTGATARRQGYAERAGAGTLFLDEVAELPLALQAKLLRLVEAKEFSRLGGTAVLPFRARILAATNTDIDAQVRERRFREDLLYRLDVIRVEIPPLRSRPEDILHLARQFLEVAASQSARVIRGFEEHAEEALKAHQWPGNARELRNRVDRAVAMADGPWIGAADLFPDRGDQARRVAGGCGPKTLAEVVVAAERGAVLDALKAAGWDVGGAAAMLGVGRSTLFEKVRRLGLARPENHKSVS